MKNIFRNKKYFPTRTLRNSLGLLLFAFVFLALLSLILAPFDEHINDIFTVSIIIIVFSEYFQLKKRIIKLENDVKKLNQK